MTVVTRFVEGKEYTIDLDGLSLFAGNDREIQDLVEKTIKSLKLDEERKAANSAQAQIRKFKAQLAKQFKEHRAKEKALTPPITT